MMDPAHVICCGAWVGNWHTFFVRCDAVIPSGYRVTFTVLVTRLAGELLTETGSRASA
jgi:hypothetical protein